METKTAVCLLYALAQETRLSIFRLLVAEGDEGLPVGAIAEQLQVAASTLSFHLKELTHAGLIEARQDGRFIYYSANYPAMDDLLQFLTEDCCGGQACAVKPASSSKRRKKS